MKRHVAWLVTIASLVARAPARAEPPAGQNADGDAVALYSRARSQFEAGDDAAALASIEASLARLDSPNSELLRAHVLLKLQRRVEAMRAYARALEGAKARVQAGEQRFEPTLAEAGRSMGLLGATLAELEVQVEGCAPDCAATVGGAALTLGAADGTTFIGHLWHEPGEALVIVTSRGGEHRKKAALAAGARQRVRFDLRPAPSEPPARSYAPPTASWALGGVGFAGLVTFATFGGLALAIDADLEACSASCGPARRGDADRGKAFQITANVGAAVGGAALVAAAIVWIVDAASPRAAGSLAARGQGLELRF